MNNNRDFVVFILGKLEEYLDGAFYLDYLMELENDLELLKSFEDNVKDVDFFKKKVFSNVYELGIYRIINYIIARSNKPKYFIETGVLHGMTTNFILSAVSKNSCGEVHSIDLPSYFDEGPANKDGYIDTLPPNKEPGWIIKNDLVKNWNLHIGNSLNILPELCKKIGEIDIFLHDSDHTYETMRCEFEIAWVNLKRGGVLIADNIDANTAFFDFCRGVEKTPFVFSEGNSLDKRKIRFGLIKK